MEINYLRQYLAEIRHPIYVQIPQLEYYVRSD